MTIRNTLVLLAVAAAPPGTPYVGQDWDSDYTIVEEEPIAFDCRYDQAPVGIAFDEDHATQTYRASSGFDVYGTYRRDNGVTAPGLHRIGSELAKLYDGFDEDFALWAQPREPVGFEGVAFDSDYTVGRHVANTYPPPISFDEDYVGVGIAFDEQYSSGVYLAITSSAIEGVYTRDTDPAWLTGTPLTVPSPFVREQMLPGTFADDRFGNFTLGYTVLGGPSV